MFDRLTQYGVDPTGRGASNMSALTVPRMSEAYRESPASEADEGDPEAHPATAGNPLTFLFIILGTIVALYFVRKSSSLIAGETFGVNWFSFLQVTVMSMGGILLTKALFGRFNVPGISNAVAAI
jgi:hypothetical protein